MTVKPTRITVTTLALSVLLLMPTLAFSSDSHGYRDIPSSDGITETQPGVVARICGVECQHTINGILYAFEIEVFSESWTPIYRIEIEEIGSTSIQPVSSPMGWEAHKSPTSFSMPDVLTFYTHTDPILPGTRIGGFSVLATGAQTVFRWYPADESGTLIGKVTRTQFSCATSSGATTWGSLKAMYK